MLEHYCWFSSKLFIKNTINESRIGVNKKRHKKANKIKYRQTLKTKTTLQTSKRKMNQKLYNKFLINLVCSVCTGKHLPSVFSHRPRSFVARSVRKPQANTFPYRPRTRLISLYYRQVASYARGLSREI